MERIDLKYTLAMDTISDESVRRLVRLGYKQGVLKALSAINSRLTPTSKVQDVLRMIQEVTIQSDNLPE